MQPVQPDGVFTGWTSLQPAIVVVSFFAGGILVRTNGWLWFAGIPFSFWVSTVVDTSARPAEEPILGWFVVPAYVVGSFVVGYIGELLADAKEERRKEREHEEWRQGYI